MGWGEKTNPNSEWNKKRHPVIVVPINKIFLDKKIGLWHRLVNFIKRTFGQPKSAKGNLSPKES